jgi:hypothetical protein
MADAETDTTVGDRDDKPWASTMPTAKLLDDLRPWDVDAGASGLESHGFVIYDIG